MRLRLWPRSLLLRLTLLFSCMALLVLIALGFVITRAINHHFATQDYRTLSHQIDMVEYDFKNIPSTENLKEQITEILKRHNVLAIVINDWAETFSSPGMPAVDAATLTKAQQPLLFWSDGVKHYRIVKQAFNTTVPNFESGEIIAALDVTHHENFLEAFHNTMWIIIAATAVCMGMVGWIAARIVLLPLRHIIKSTSQVSADNLDVRIPTDAIPPDMRELAQVLNAMLDKLEAAFKRLSDFSYDLAHELRTPLSNMKVQTQVALTAARTAEEYREILLSNIEELEQLSRIVDNILFLAKTENGLEAPAPIPMQMEVEFAELFDFYGALAESRDITFSLTGQAAAHGDRTMLRRAFSNILSNAIKYGFPSSVISVALSQPGNQYILIAISNTGETIAPEHLSRVFDRFYRISGKTESLTEGTGLGLAITQSIIQAHGGTITVQSAQNTTTFIITLPRI